MVWQPWDHVSCAGLADKTIHRRKLKISAMDIMDISTSVLLNGMSESLINEWWAPRVSLSKDAVVESCCCCFYWSLLLSHWKGKKFSVHSVQDGVEGEERTGNILVNFCAQMLENLFSHANTDFWLQQLQASLVAPAKIQQVKNTRMAFYLPHHVCVITSATSTKKR